MTKRSVMPDWREQRFMRVMSVIGAVLMVAFILCLCKRFLF